MKIISVNDFYKDVSAGAPDLNSKEIGHFDVFDLKALIAQMKGKPEMPYNRRAYYKISLICGKNTAEYADKIIEIDQYALLFATPKIPYNWIPMGPDQSGYFCIFTEDFLNPGRNGVSIDELPIFKAGGYPVFEVSSERSVEIALIFKKMISELSSAYTFKFDLLRNYILELIHYGQKLQPASASYPMHTASARVSSLFEELLERQFPIESVGQKLQLRTAKAYADRLSVHVNHLNKVLKEQTGKTTTEIISDRIIREAKLLLRQTDWNISEISYCLGFEEIAHFSNFFRKQTKLSPVEFRS